MNLRFETYLKFIAIIVLCFSGIQSSHLQAQDTKEYIIAENYNDLEFDEFVTTISDKHDVQFYYFSGWIKGISIIQNETPTSLKSILENTFKGSENKFYISPSNQIIITRKAPITSKLNLVDSIDILAMDKNKDTYSINVIKRQEEQLADPWIVIGDPQAPEQKPEVTLRGYVKIAETEEPIEEAIIYIEEFKTGTTTDQEGYFELVLPQGRYSLLIQSIGLKEEVKKIQLYASGDLDINLSSLTLNIEEFVVRANRKQSVESVQMGTEQLQVDKIKELPTLFGEIDLVRSALMLPGVQSASEFASGINVRGGSSDQNLVLLNGAPIYNSSHLFGFSSSFSPDVVEGLDLYKSSIPVRFGGRISSVLDIKMKDGNYKKWGLKGGVSPVTSRVTLEGPIIKDHTSIIISGRSTYSDWILKRIENASFRNSSANYYDGTAHISSKIGQNDKLDISAYYSNDDFQLNGDTTYSYQNFNLAGHYKHAFSEKLFGTLSAIYSKYGFNVSSEKQALRSYDLAYSIQNIEGKAHFSYALKEDHQVNFGIQIVNYSLSPGNLKPLAASSLVSPIDLEQEKAIAGSIYLRDEWTVSDNFSINAGLRFTSYSYLGPKTINQYIENQSLTEDRIIGKFSYNSGDIIKAYSGLEYRVSMRYSLDENNSVIGIVNI